jgi:hypothetical protein
MTNMAPEAWLVIGAEARRPFADEAEARAYAGDWGIVKPLYLATSSPAKEEPWLTPAEEAEIVADINSGRWPYLHPLEPVTDWKARCEALEKALGDELVKARNELFDLRIRCGCGPDQEGPDIWLRAGELEAVLKELLPMVGWRNLSDDELRWEAEQGNEAAPKILRARAVLEQSS